MKATALVVLLLLLVPVGASAGPWVRDAGDGYLKLGFTHYRADTGQDGSASLAYRSNTYNVYGELGIGADLQLLFDVPYVDAQNYAEAAENRFRHRSTGNVRLELDYALPVTSRLVWAVGVETSIPAYRDPADYDDADGLADAQFEALAASFPALGDGVVSNTFKVLGGYGFRNAPGWTTFEGGYRVRYGGLADSFYAAGGAGMFVVRRYLAVGTYGSLDIAAPWDNSTPAQQLAYLQGYLLITGLDSRSAVGISLAGGGIVWAENTSAGFDVSGSLSYTF